MSQSEATTETPDAAVPLADTAKGQPPAADASGTGQPDAKAAGGDLLDKASEGEAKDAASGDLLSVDENAPKEGVPDQYTFEPPEGFTPDQEAIDAAMAAAKDAGLTQKQFDAMAKFDIERTQAANEQAVEAWHERVEGWREAARTDKEFGGPDYEANIKTALSAAEKFGDAEFTALLKSPSESNPEGLAIGNHPAVLRFLNRIGKALGDPSLVSGTEGQTAADSDESSLRRMYPSMFKESA